MPTSHGTSAWGRTNMQLCQLGKTCHTQSPSAWSQKRTRAHTCTCMHGVYCKYTMKYIITICYFSSGFSNVRQLCHLQTCHMLRIFLRSRLCSCTYVYALWVIAIWGFTVVARLFVFLFIATHRSLVGVHAQTTNVRSHQKSFAFEEDYRRLKKQRSGIVVRGGFLKKNNNNNALLAY